MDHPRDVTGSIGFWGPFGRLALAGSTSMAAPVTFVRSGLGTSRTTTDTHRFSVSRASWRVTLPSRRSATSAKALASPFLIEKRLGFLTFGAKPDRGPETVTHDCFNRRKPKETLMRGGKAPKRSLGAACQTLQCWPPEFKTAAAKGQ
jgi:hypothetical protein